MAVPGRKRTLQIVILVSADRVNSDCGLQLHDQSGTDRFDDRRCTRFLTADRVLDVLVIVGVDVGDSSASDNVGNPIGQ